MLQSFVYFQFACALIERTKRYDVYLKTSKRYISYSCSSERKRKGRKKEEVKKKIELNFSSITWIRKNIFDKDKMLERKDGL